jgi:tetratricopeptide (TPR) repeat protein
MKRFLIILFAVLGFSLFSVAQELTQESVQRRLNRSDSNIEHSRRSQNPRTWVDRGVIFQDIFDVNIQFLYFGMAEDELRLFMSEPKERRTIETETGVRDVLVYDNIEIYFEQGELIGWNETNVLHENPLDEAYASFQKAIELDDRGRQERRLREAFTRLHGQFISNAVLNYEEGDYSSSFEDFKKSLDVADSPFYDQPVDTGLVFNTGFVASLAGNHEDAIEYFNRAKEMNYRESNLYVLLKDAYVNIGDSISAEKILQEGFQKFPQDNTVLVELVNFYINADNAQQALNYLALAKEQEPNNPSYHFAEGTLYERIGEPEKAVPAYERALELDPDLFEPNYNMGVMHYNHAVNMLIEANEIMDNVKFEAARDAAYDELRLAVPFLEQAHKADPEHEDTMDTLRIIYYRLGMEEKLEEMNKKLGRETMEQ